MAEIFPNAVTEDTKRQIASSVHSCDAQVRDEAAKFILNVCGRNNSELKSGGDLLEFQKLPKGATKLVGEDLGDEFNLTINFSQEPAKSKRQLR